MESLMLAGAVVAVAALVAGAGWKMRRKPAEPAAPARRVSAAHRSARHAADRTREEIATRQRELEEARARRSAQAVPVRPVAKVSSRDALLEMLERNDTGWGGHDGFAPTQPAGAFDTRH